MKSIPQDVSKSTKRRNPHLYGGVSVPPLEYPEVVAAIVSHKPPTRIRQSSKPLMNKLEQEWFEELNRRYPGRHFLAQSIKFRLGNGIVYTPDVFNFSDFSFPSAWEVKGKFAHRGGFENLKVAASIYQRINWFLVWKEQGQWKEQTVLP